MLQEKLKFTSHWTSYNGIFIYFYKSLTVFPHYHSHDFYEFFLITEGPVIHICNEVETILNEGCLVFIRPEDRHKYKKCEEHDFSFFNIAFCRETAEKLFALYGKEYITRELLKPKTPLQIELNIKELTGLCDKLNHFNSIEGHQERGFYATGILAELMMRVPTPRADKLHPQWFASLLNQLKEKENFTAGLDILNSLVNRSREHVTRCFKKYLKLTPTEYINSLKLNYAANLLASTNLEIITIAEEAGFENLSHFYHLFKKKYGQSPGKYRNINYPALREPQHHPESREK